MDTSQLVAATCSLCLLDVLIFFFSFLVISGRAHLIHCVYSLLCRMYCRRAKCMVHGTSSGSMYLALGHAQAPMLSYHACCFQGHAYAWQGF